MATISRGMSEEDELKAELQALKEEAGKLQQDLQRQTAWMDTQTTAAAKMEAACASACATRVAEITTGQVARELALLNTRASASITVADAPASVLDAGATLQRTQADLLATLGELAQQEAVRTRSIATLERHIAASHERMSAATRQFDKVLGQVAQVKQALAVREMQDAQVVAALEAKRDAAKKVIAEESEAQASKVMQVWEEETQKTVHSEHAKYEAGAARERELITRAVEGCYERASVRARTVAHELSAQAASEYSNVVAPLLQRCEEQRAAHAGAAGRLQQFRTILARTLADVRAGHDAGVNVNNIVDQLPLLSSASAAQYARSSSTSPAALRTLTASPVRLEQDSPVKRGPRSGDTPDSPAFGTRQGPPPVPSSLMPTFTSSVRQTRGRAPASASLTAAAPQPRSRSMERCGSAADRAAFVSSANLTRRSSSVQPMGESVSSSNNTSFLLRKKSIRWTEEDASASFYLSGQLRTSRGASERTRSVLRAEDVDLAVEYQDASSLGLSVPRARDEMRGLMEQVVERWTLLPGFEQVTLLDFIRRTHQAVACMPAPGGGSEGAMTADVTTDVAALYRHEAERRISQFRIATVHAKLTALMSEFRSTEHEMTRVRVHDPLNQVAAITLQERLEALRPQVQEMNALLTEALSMYRDAFNEMPPEWTVSAQTASALTYGGKDTASLDGDSVWGPAASHAAVRSPESRSPFGSGGTPRGVTVDDLLRGARSPRV